MKYAYSKSPWGQVGRAVTGNSNVHAVVRAAFVSEIDLRVRFTGERLKIVPICLLCMLSAFAQLSQAQSGIPSVPEANPRRPTVSTPATLTPIGYLQFENVALFAEDSAEFSKPI